MHFNPDELELINKVKDEPSVSMILPIRPKVALRSEAAQIVKFAVDKARKQLKEIYPEQYSSAIEKSLDKAVGGIDYSAVKSSIAIYASPSLFKVFHLEVPVDEKIVIDSSFEIRDLVYAKQPSSRYIALLINGRQVKAFLSDNGGLMKLNLDIPDLLTDYDNDVAERVTNFSDPSERKEIVQDKYLKRIDTALSGILKTHKVPVFLVGVDRIIGHFRSISANNKAITDIIHGNYNELSILEIVELLQPHVYVLKNKEKAALLDEIEKAANAHKLVSGIRAVLKAAKEKSGRLLIIEQNYVYPEAAASFHVRDAVDDVIEEVIRSGGEVRFVEEGILEEYQHIVLLRYY